jgi:signal transduction histidine kinase
MEELKELADTFDGMLDQLDTAFDSQRRFVANASHELRTPLTVMRTAVDVTLAKSNRTPEQLDTMAIEVRQAVTDAEAQIDALLTLARSDRRPDGGEFVDVATAAEDAVDAVGADATATACGSPSPTRDRPSPPTWCPPCSSRSAGYTTGSVPGKGWASACPSSARSCITTAVK